MFHIFAMKTFSGILSRFWLLFSILWLCTAFLYLPAWKAGFMADFLGLFPQADNFTFSEFLNRKGTRVQSLYQVTQLQLYIFIRLWGTHFIPWFLLVTGLHSLNAALAFRFFKNLFEDFRLTNARLVALAGCLLFLVNPNITEITVWKGGYHYLTGVLMQLLILIWCRRFLINGEKRSAWLAAALFAVSSFTLEIFYVTPFLVLFLLTGYYLKSLIPKILFRKGLKYLLLPQVVLFAVHLIIFKLVYGHWIPHYGNTASFSLETDEILPRAGKYLYYIIFMGGFHPQDFRMQAYEFLSRPYICIPICLAMALFPFWVLWKFRKLEKSVQLAGFLAGATACCLALVMPIFFEPLFSVSNSRFTYQPGLFIYMLLALMFFNIFKNQKLLTGIFSCYLLLCLILAEKKIFEWRKAAKVQYGILRTFGWQDTGPVLLLNLPAYYRDIRVVPASPYNEFNQQLHIFGYDTIRAKLYEVSSYNMQNLWDGAHVTVLDSMSLKITLNQWGTWWMYNNLGAANYETDWYKVEMTDPGHEYLLKLKSKPENLSVLFLQDIYWRKVDFSKPGEQW